MRESVRLESKRRRVRERFLNKDLTSSYLEGDEDLEENEVWIVQCSMCPGLRRWAGSLSFHPILISFAHFTIERSAALFLCF